jgi:hypothetical protein
MSRLKVSLIKHSGGCAVTTYRSVSFKTDILSIRGINSGIIEKVRITFSVNLSAGQKLFSNTNKR